MTQGLAVARERWANAVTVAGINELAEGLRVQVARNPARLETALIEAIHDHALKHLDVLVVDLHRLTDAQIAEIKTFVETELLSGNNLKIIILE